MGDRGSAVSEDHDEKRPDQNHPVPAVSAQVNAIMIIFTYTDKDIRSYSFYIDV